MKKYFLIITYFLFAFSYAQKDIIVSGYVQDKQTGEKIIDVNVYIPELQLGTTTNEYGYYSISIPKNKKLDLLVGYVGYQTEKIKIFTKTNLIVNVELTPDNSLETVELYTKKQKKNITGKDVSSLQLSVGQVKQLPAIGGEPDLMKAFQLLPGISSGKEGSSDLFVRGGSPDQNLILLDDVPLYYVNHLGGFVSVFNVDAINHMKLIKGGFPAKFGNRLSSVVDIQMKEGNKHKRAGNFSIGLLNAKLSLEGPINKKMTYMISGRRLLYDLIMFPISYIGTDRTSSFGYYFYDFNGKISYHINNKNHLNFSIYGGDDIFSIRNYKDRDNVSSSQGDKESKYKKKWGNKLVAIRWHSVLSAKTEMISVLSYSKYRFNISKTTQSERFDNNSFFLSDIQDLRLKNMFNINLSKHYKLNLGDEISYHWFNPSVQSVKQTEDNILVKDITNSSFKQQTLHYNFYVENKINIGKRLFVNLGLRNSNLNINGKTFTSIEPRLLFNFKLNKSTSLKGAYTQMQQNLHLLSTTGLGMPIDLWLPATQLAPPENSTQYVFGFSKDLKKNRLRLDIETYYKTIDNLITYKPGASFQQISEHWEEKILNNGKGTSYGIEFLLQKKSGKHTGWISYTWSKTDRKFSGINQGEAYPFRYDRRNDISIVYNYNFNKNISFSATWNYGTGYPFSMAVYKFYGISNLSYFEGNTDDLFEYTVAYKNSKPNAFRMKDFHRLDIGVNFVKQKKHGIRTWNFSIINVYNRKNPYFYYLGEEKIAENKYKTVLKQLTLFPFLPSFSYSYKF